MAARNVGSATPRLKAGDVVSIESTHFDAPGRPGSYSAGAGFRRRPGPYESRRVLYCDVERQQHLDGEPLEAPAPRA